MTVIFKLCRIIPFLSILCCFVTAHAQDSVQVITMNKTRNVIGTRYDLTSFDKGVNKPWHLLSLEYTREVKKSPLTVRLNYANRFSRSGLQLEADAYPVISKKMYAYLNAGYSKDVMLFPKYRGGMSLYLSLPAAFEAEGGLRLLHFNSSRFIYTASLGKYYKKYWFNASTFLSPDSSSISKSYFFKTRYYLDDKDFVMLTLGTGISPDDKNNNIQFAVNNKLRSKKIELSFRRTIWEQNIILVSSSWMRQEYEYKKFTGQYNISIGFQRLF